MQAGVYSAPVEALTPNSPMPHSVEPVSHIVVALGGKRINSRVIHEAVRMAHLLEAEIKVVHMRWPGAGELTMMMEPLPVFTEEELRSQFRDVGYEDEADSVVIEIFEGKSVAKLLAKVTLGADMLIIGHKYRNRLQAALSTGSLQQQILDVITCPVLVVPRVRK